MAWFDDQASAAAAASDEAVASGGGFTFVSDQADAAKLGNMQPGPAEMPWYERLLQYGATKAIDSHYQDQAASRYMQTQAMGIQGANGYTYRPGVQAPLFGATGPSLMQIVVFGLIGFAALKLAHD